MSIGVDDIGKNPHQNPHAWLIWTGQRPDDVEIWPVPFCLVLLDDSQDRVDFHTCLW